MIQDENGEFVAKLFLSNREQLERRLTHILGSPALARDVAQDAYQRLCTVDLTAIEHPVAYLFQIGTNLSISVTRRRKVEALSVLHSTPIEDDPERIVGPEASAIRAQNIAYLRKQIWLLSPALSEVVAMRYLEDMKPTEIIERLGISISAYEQRITAGKRQLKQRLRALGIDSQGF